MNCSRAASCYPRWSSGAVLHTYSSVWGRGQRSAPAPWRRATGRTTVWCTRTARRGITPPSAPGNMTPGNYSISVLNQTQDILWTISRKYGGHTYLPYKSRHNRTIIHVKIWNWEYNRLFDRLVKISRLIKYLLQLLSVEIFVSVSL